MVAYAMSIDAPSFSQLIAGRGFPFAAQSRVTFAPSTATVVLGVAMNSGGIERVAPSSNSNKIQH